MRILSKYFHEIEKIIAANYSISQSKNSSDKGEDREEFLVRLLNNHLPSISRATRGGAILDCLDRLSSQTDIVVNSSFAPQLCQNTKPMFLAEGCFAAIEVKSTLNASALKQAMKWSTRIKSMRKFLDTKTSGILKCRNSYNSICTGIFAYKSSYKKPETILKNIFNYSENGLTNSQMIDFVCVNNLCCISRDRTEDVDGYIPASGSTKTLEEVRGEYRYSFSETPFVSMLDTILKYISYIGPSAYSLNTYLHDVTVYEPNGDKLTVDETKFKNL